MSELSTPDDPVTCGICGRTTSIAMIAVHLEQEHDVDTSEIADAPVVDETDVPRLYFPERGTIRPWEDD